MIRIVIIGAGYMACKHLEAIRTVEGFEVCGIMSRSFERAEALCKEFRIPVCATSIQELFRETTADVVLIAVNELSSPSVIDKALDYKINDIITDLNIQ